MQAVPKFLTGIQYSLREGVKKVDFLGDMSPKLWPPPPLSPFYITENVFKKKNIQDIFYILSEKSLFFWVGGGSTPPPW